MRAQDIDRIPLSWINDVIGDFLRDTSRVPQGTFWRTYSLLEVYIPPSEYILALKLLATGPGLDRYRDGICLTIAWPQIIQESH